MESSRIDDEDGDLLASTSNTSSRRNFHCYSEKFAFNSDSDSDDGENVSTLGGSGRKFSLDETERTPKLFDRFYGTSSSNDEEFSSSSGQNSVVRK